MFLSGLLTLSLASVWAQDTLDIRVNTGTPETAPPSIAAPQRSGRSLPPIPQSNRGSLPSRGGRPQLAASGASAMKVKVRVGTVTAAKTVIRTTRAADADILSTAKKGMNLAVLSEMDDQYGVLMVNGVIGWVPKNTIDLLDFETEVTLQPETPAPTKSVATNERAGLVDRADLSSKQRSVLREAFTYMGVPYVWAGNTRSGLDCSAFLKNVFSTVGVTLPRHSGHQISVGTAISDGANLQPGDRLYFAMKGGSTITHCGLYIGDGYFIHASTNHGCVDIDPLAKPSYASKLVAVRRD